MEGNPAALQRATLPRCLSRLRAIALPPGPRGTAALLSLRVQRLWRLHRGCADRASNKHRSLASQIMSARSVQLVLGRQVVADRVNLEQGRAAGLRSPPTEKPWSLIPL